jgi:hypothetical protein
MASYSMFNKHHICGAARDKSCRTVTAALTPSDSSLAQWKPPSRSHKSTHAAAIAFYRVSSDLTVVWICQVS